MAYRESPATSSTRGFPGVGTMGMAVIAIETYSYEYNMYFKVIIQQPGTPNRKCSRGQALFRGCISEGGHYGYGWNYY